MNLGVAGNTGRALLVAALLVSVYALVHYWRSLDGRSSQVRYALVSLRAITFVLLSCALAGVRVEYESAARARLLLRVAGDDQASAHEQIITALEAKGFEIDEDEAEAAPSDGFVAGVLLTGGAMSAEAAQH